jgi:4-amino-4-deoxy-L-arabinose transferase-like glycosyltransferase
MTTAAAAQGTVGQAREYFREMLESPRTVFKIVALGLLLRAGLLLLLPVERLYDDARDYHQAALSILAGQPYEPDWPPGLPYYLAGAYRLLGASPWAGRLAVVALYPVFCAVLYHLGKKLDGRATANLSLIVFAVLPSYLYMSVTPLTQLLTAVLVVGTCLCAIGLRAKPSWKLSLLLGALLTALVLVRSSHVLLAAVLPVVLWWRTRSWRVLLAPALVLSVGLGLWTYRAREMTGRWVFINNANSQNAYYGNNPWTPLYRTWWFGSHKQGEPGVPEAFVAQLRSITASPPKERDRLFSAHAWRHVTERPELFVVRTASRVRAYFAADSFAGAQLVRKHGLRWLGLGALGVQALVHFGLLAFAAAWLAGRTAQRARAAALWSLLVGLLCAVPYFVSFSHPTYHFSVLPILGVLGAAKALSWMNGQAFVAAKRGSARWWIAWGVVALLLFVQVEFAVHAASRF